ncbi:hypothetical protein KL944_005228 [Ogataea haglerorum]|nr:hypothetical protein KL944_005228 [Ogataea haglerorum]
MANYLPVGNGTRSFWLTAETEFGSTRTTEDLPSEVDVLIIGGGYAGATTAYYLLNGKNPPESVLLLEARTLCSGATGRNGGHFKPSFYSSSISHTEKYGQKACADITNFEMAHLKELREVLEKEKLECEYIVTRGCDVYTSEKGAQKAIANFHHMMENPYVENKHEFQLHVGDRAKILSKMPDALACITGPAGQMWPYKLMVALLEICATKGLNIQANTPVLRTEKQKDGKYLVHTERGDVIAKALVIATNAYTASVEPRFENKIVPIKGICSHITPSGNKAPAHLTNSYGLLLAQNSDYLINRPDGSIILGGAKEHLFPYKERFYNVVDDSTLVPDAESYFEGYMEKNFYSWQDSKSAVAKVWSGIMGYADDGLPYVGELDEKKYILAGFGGHGMPRILLCAKAVAKYIKGGSSEFEVPRPFLVTRERMEQTENGVLESLQAVVQK